jgi:hypothetical protein
MCTYIGILIRNYLRKHGCVLLLEEVWVVYEGVVRAL